MITLKRVNPGAPEVYSVSILPVSPNVLGKQREHRLIKQHY